MLACRSMICLVSFVGKPWKQLEKKTAEALGGVRINRAADYGVSDVDVLVSGFDFLRCDCKYRSSWAHHSFVEEIRKKYCNSEGQSPVLITKHRNGRQEYVTVDLSLFASLLDQIRKLRQNGANGAESGRAEEKKETV